jgi:hypothetical protein
VRLAFDWKGLRAPLVIDPAFSLPFWSILSDARVPGATTYDPTLQSREAHLAFDSLRGRTVLVRPVRSQLDADTIMISGNPSPSFLSNRSISPNLRTHSAPPFLGANAASDWQRGYGLESETWEWDGGAWTLVSSARLRGLIDPALAFDIGRGRMVAYGGAAPSDLQCSSASTGFLCQVAGVSGVGDQELATYEYDGAAWTTKRIAGSPPPRLRAAMAWSRSLGKIVLFGGRAFGASDIPAVARNNAIVTPHGPPYPENLTANLLNDTWTYDGTAWVPVLTGSPPPPSEGAQLVYEEQRNVVVLVGGHTSDEIAPNVDRLAIWEFDGIDWTQKLGPGDPNKPVSIRTRRGAAAFYNPLRQRVTILGGTVGKLDFCTMSDGDIASQLAATQNDPVGRRALQASGCLGGFVHDAWEWDGSKLTKVADVVFSGVVGQQPVFAQAVGAAPWATEGAAASVDGGSVVNTPTAFISYRYDRTGNHFPLRTRLERARFPADAGIPPPLSSTSGVEIAATAAAASPLFAAQVHPYALFDAVRGVAMIFAPDAGSIFDTDGASWTVRTPARTPFSNGANDFLAATWDSANQRILAFDPRDGSTWTYTDASGWSAIATNGPPAWRVDPAIHAKRDFIRTDSDKAQGSESAAFMAALPQVPQMAFDRTRRRVVMLYQQATWEFDGAVWTRFSLPPSWTVCAASPLLAFDGARNVTVAFGCNVPADTWQWDGAQWTGPGPTPYTGGVERTQNGLTFVQLPNPNVADWFGTLQVAWSHPNAAFESATLGGVSTIDADGTLRTWNGTNWMAGPKISSQAACALSGWDPSRDAPPMPGGSLQAQQLLGDSTLPDTQYWLGREFLPTCFSPPVIEDTANGRLLAFRDGPIGLLELPFAAPSAQRRWRFVRLGTEGTDDPNVRGAVQANPYPFELMAPETIRLTTQSAPGSRTGQFGYGYVAATAPEKIVQNLWWPYRVLVDPVASRVRLLTNRGVVWELAGEAVATVHSLGDPCGSDLDCSEGLCGTEGVCCDLGKPCTQAACKTCKGATPGVCGPVSAGQPDPSGTCGTGPCTGTCPGTLVASSPASCTYHPTVACGPPDMCSAGVETPGGHCAPNSGACIVPGAQLPNCPVVSGVPDVSSPCVVAAHPCANDVACAEISSCKAACVLRSDCASRYNDCDPLAGTCTADQASLLAAKQGVSPAPRDPPPLRTNQEIAALLVDAGYPLDDAGRVLIESVAGMGLAFDPNHRDIVSGVSLCLDYVESCMMLNKTIDGCVASARRCASSTPWLGDPSGDDCCPHACLLQYFTNRLTMSDEDAVQVFLRSNCYAPPSDAGAGGG